METNNPEEGRVETVTIEREGLPYVVVLAFDADGDVWVCRAVTLQDSAACPVGFRSTVTRTVDLPGLIDEARAGLPELGRVDPVPLMPGRSLGDDHYRVVAEVYRGAMRVGDPPTKAVAVQLVGDAAKLRTASRWVTEARARGFLGETTPGRKGV